VPLVCDASSDALSRPVDVAGLGVLYAGAQKNLGPAGVTLVIVRKELLERTPGDLPAVLDYRLMAENRVRVVTTPVGDRYVSEALAREGGLLGGEQSGHVIWLGNHATGDGLGAALLLCRALAGRAVSDAAAVMPRFPQVKRNVAASGHELPQAVQDEVDRLNRELGADGRILVRPSGTEPLVRVLVEMENAQDAETMCASIAALVERELG
jgi:phosphoglucosamine mutase